MRLLTLYTWPGNLRELQSVLKHAIIQSTGPVLLADCLPENIRDAVGSDMTAATNSTALDAFDEEDLDRCIKQQVHLDSSGLYDEIIQKVERVLLTELLNQVDGNVSRASAILGISRSTLRVKLAALGIIVDRTVQVVT